MRRNPTEKGVIIILWLSSVIFGLVHVTNAIAGAPLSLSIGQAAYAAGVGMVLGAVYLRTGNLWPSILGHIAGAAGIFWGLYLVRPAKRPEIVELWKNKWSVYKQ